jgi:hypothetical protein
LKNGRKAKKTKTAKQQTNKKIKNRMMQKEN